MTPNPTSTYTPTLMEKLLGRNYKWWYIILYNLKSLTAYIASEFALILSNSLIYFVTLYIWSLSNRDDTGEVLVYLVIGNLFLSLTTMGTAWDVHDDIFTGSISSKLLLPTGYFQYRFFTGLANLIKDGFQNIVIIFTISIWFLEGFSLNQNFLYLPLLLIIAYCLRFFLEFIIGSSAFFIIYGYGLIRSFLSVLPLLAGAMIPLNLIHKNFQIIKYTPFSYLLHHPMQIYLGKYAPIETFYVFAGGIFWCVALYFLAKLVFKVGLKRNESVGL